ncbi:MAG: PSD1 domain-containing protein [Verrucomicrobiae bacterium]|nr:PSD1 domain-containing protein [Verrucomicrobiae bacterium]
MKPGSSPTRFLTVPALAFALVSSAAPRSSAAPPKEISFRRDVRPILSDKCFACHGPDAKKREAKLRLDTQEDAFADRGGYAAIVPGDLEKSELIYRLDPADADDKMPPAKFHKPLTFDEAAILKQWVKDGAQWESHWAYTPLVRPEAPPVENAPGGFVRGEIDRFLLAAMREHGLEPSPEADRVTLARRLYLDLTGLPPTPEQVDAFVNDGSDRAWETLVAELLDSRHFGERLAIYWLDLVRYADTIGYHSDNPMEVSAYRDYVIDAFNDNLPFDRFTVEQLAGDLLPGATVRQRVASGYNRLLQTTEEGGAQPKEYLAIYAADRVRNLGEVWLGSTTGCAQCHDHKYDPFTMRDFYSMAAFFADLKENPTGRRAPNLKLPTPEEETEMAVLRENLAGKTLPKILAADPALAEKVEAARQKWETGLLAELGNDDDAWRVVKPESLKSSGGQDLAPRPDGSVLAGGKKNPDRDTYTATLKAAGKITALRVEALTDPSLTKKSLSRANGNFVLTDVKLSIDGKAAAFSAAAADFEQDGYPVANLIDDDPKSGWAGNGHVEAKDRAAVLTLAAPADLGEGGVLTVELSHQSPHAKHNIGRFRLSLTGSASPSVKGGPDVPVEVLDALKIAAADRDAAQAESIAAHYRTLSPDLAPHRKNLDDWKQRLDAIDKGLRTMLVSEAIPEPRAMRVLPRGNWLDDSGDEVQPAVPEFLARAKIEGRRATRLDLANWIVSPDNPLTARAFVNRMWKLFYGRGLSRDLNDLGGQGQPPSHPELLDWLAVEFRDSGWDVKKLVTLLVGSGAYRQSSTPTPEAREKDPGNVWLARQGRWRLEAELVRDTALALSGLLVNDLGGRSVKPYQPAGFWEHLNFPKREWQADSGEKLYRRGLYTFWCRTFPHPALTAFDAPSREECTAERSRSNTPQQALVLLNDPVFVEAARVFAEKIARLPGDDAARIAVAWKTATGREPAAEESRVLTGLLVDQRARFQSDPEAARALVAIGESPAPTGDLDPGELAALTQVARAILNAYETTSRF